KYATSVSKPGHCALNADGHSRPRLSWKWVTMADQSSVTPEGAMENPAREDVTVLLGQLTKGEEGAASKLIPLVYGELRRLAKAYMRRERADHTLQATALVHEAFLKLVEQRSVDWQGRAHFLGIAAQMMRRILIDHARGHLRDKCGAGAKPVP